MRSNGGPVLGHKIVDNIQNISTVLEDVDEPCPVVVMVGKTTRICLRHENDVLVLPFLLIFVASSVSYIIFMEYVD